VGGITGSRAMAVTHINFDEWTKMHYGLQTGSYITLCQISWHFHFLCT